MEFRGSLECCAMKKYEISAFDASIKIQALALA